MAVTTSHRTPLKRGAGAPERPEQTPRQRLTMAAVCYIGLAVIVGLTFILSRVAPTPVAASVFLLGAGLVVGVLHPRVFSHVAHRR